MKNLLILIVAFALFLHFYPQPELERWYNDKKESALKLFSKATDTKVRLKSDKIFTDLAPQLQSFNVEEQKHLHEITATRDNVKDFYETYCGTNKRHFAFHPNNQAKVCRTIAKYSGML